MEEIWLATVRQKTIKFIVFCRTVASQPQNNVFNTLFWGWKQTCYSPHPKKTHSRLHLRPRPSSLQALSGRRDFALEMTRLEIALVVLAGNFCLDLCILRHFFLSCDSGAALRMLRALNH